jgi:hypothetical protein
MTEDAGAAPKVSGLRYKLALFLFAFPFVTLVGAPILVPMLGMSAGKTATTIGATVLVGEMIGLSSIPILGKQGFLDLKRQLLRFFGLGGPATAGRHRLGVRLAAVSFTGEAVFLVLFVASIFIGREGEAQVLGLTLTERAIAFAWVEIVSTTMLLVGLALVHPDVWERAKVLFDWPGERGA